MSSPSPDRLRSWRPALQGASRYLPLLGVCCAVGIVLAVVPSLPATLAGSGGGIPGAGSGVPAAPVGPSATAGGSGASAAGGGAAGGGVSGGVSSSGTAITSTFTGSPDCSREAVMNATVLGGGTCRPPHWSGSNGGATYHGVTGNTINIVVYRPQQNQAVATALQQAGQASNAQQQQAMAAYQNYFNTNYELYGRKLNLIFQYGPATSTTDPTLQQSDATYAASSNKAFAVAALTGTIAFNQKLASLGVPDVAFTSEQRLSEYVGESPYVTALLPDLDQQIQETAEYYCKRLTGHNAEYAGDPTYQHAPRKLGIIWVQTYTNAGPALQQALQQDCGVVVPNSDTYAYSGQTNNLAQDATTAVDNMHQAGVTTVTCLCDPVSPIVFTQQATNQGWMPEWLMNSIGLQDAPTVTRLYDQTQMRHAFGISLTGYPLDSCNAAWYKAYQQGSGGGDPASIGIAGSTTFALLAPLVAAIEEAGPNLTAKTFAAAEFHLNPTQTPFNWQHLSLGRGAHPYTMITDLTEVWWNATATGPDGKTGAWNYLNQGRRYQQGQWPTGEPALFAAGDGDTGPQDPCAP